MRKQRQKRKKCEAQKKREALEVLGFACLMTRVQALEHTRDGSNSTTERIVKLSSSDVELDGMAKVGYYGWVHYLI